MKLNLQFIQVLEAQGYTSVRQVATGEWIGLFPFLYTTGLCVGLTPWGYRTRYCYELRSEAEVAALVWEGAGDPPGDWVKRKGDQEYLNPQWRGRE